MAHTLEIVLTTLGTIATLAPLMGRSDGGGMIEIFGSQMQRLESLHNGPRYLGGPV